MVRHADKTKYKKPNYKDTDDRAVFVVIVRTLQPAGTTAGEDKTTWDNCCAVYNHIFADAIGKRLSRPYMTKTACDWIVHRYHVGRASGWLEACDAPISAEGQKKREGHLKTVLAAMAELEIDLPMDRDPDYELPLNPKHVSTRAQWIKNRANADRVDQKRADQKKKRTSLKHAMQNRVNQALASANPAPATTVAAANATDNDDGVGDNIFVAPASATTSALPQSSLMLSALAAAGDRDGTDGGKAVGNNVSKASALASVPARKNPSRKIKNLVAPVDESDEDLYNVTPPPSPNPKKKPAKGKKRHDVEVASFTDDEMETAAALNGGPFNLKQMSLRPKKSKAIGDGGAESVVMGMSNEGSGMTTKSAKRRQTTEGGKEREASDGKRPKDNNSSEELAAFSRQTKVYAPRLTVIHGNGPNVIWSRAVPHVVPLDADKPIHVSLRQNSPMYGHGGLVIMGTVPSGDLQEFQLCRKEECGWCKGNGNKIGELKGPLGLLYVHTRCVEVGADGLLKLIAVMDLHGVWEGGIPEKTKQAEMMFRDGYVRKVKVCDPKTCNICKGAAAVV